MNDVKIILKNEQETFQMGKNLAHKLKNNPCLIFLTGELGCGKTTFCKGFITELVGERTQITSPTYSLMNHYKYGNKIYHFDLYRLTNPEEIFELGLDENLNDESAFRLVEWPQIIAEKIRKPDVIIELYSQENHKIALIKNTGNKFD